MFEFAIFLSLLGLFMGAAIAWSIVRAGHEYDDECERCGKCRCEHCPEEDQ